MKDLFSGPAPTLADFYRADSPDLFHKCSLFAAGADALRDLGVMQSLYRVNLVSGLDHRVTVRDALDGQERELICFDSNSYLHLHRHPRVLAAVHEALDHVGYGTPSAQLLCGTNRYLRRLERTISRFHGRQDTVVFSSGFAANLGAITALIRTHDLVVRDRYSHTSIHDACRATGSRHQHTYGHMDCEQLGQVLRAASALDECMGKLIVTDGVFSMNGRLAPLPELRALAREHGARLMVDEAHATGVVGATGRGTEEHFGMAGEVDVLMGTFSKAPGTLGGYVTGSREMVDYLRYYAHTSMFTAAFPAALCAGVNEAFEVMDQEPWHRERLWSNVRRMASSLRQVGFDLATPHSPILTLPVGSEKTLFLLSHELFRAGIKVGNVSYPAVPRGAAILRLTVNARHTDEDMDRTVQVLARLGRRHGLLQRPAPAQDDQAVLGSQALKERA